MSEARYTDLKRELYIPIRNYKKLLKFVEQKLDIKLECVKFNEILCNKNGDVITVEKLKKMVVAALKSKDQPKEEI